MSCVDSENVSQAVEESKKSPAVLLIDISQSPPLKGAVTDISPKIATPSPRRLRLSAAKSPKDAATPSPSRRSLTAARKAERLAEREKQRLQKDKETCEKKKQQVELLRQRQAKKEEKETRRLQREAEKKARENERLKREEEKRGKEKEKEEERLKREEDKRAKEKEKEEERLKREEEKRAREEERIKREEERKIKEKEREEERRKREAEKQQKEAERQQKELERQREEEEKQRKAEKQRALLMGFLMKPSEKQSVDDSLVESESLAKGPFMRVELKKDQRSAPIFRVSKRQVDEKRANVDALVSSCKTETNSSASTSLGLRKFGQPNYLHELRTGQIKSLSCPATWPVEMPDVLCLGEGAQMRQLKNFVSQRYNHGDSGDGGTVWTKVKLFQFVENYRPAYYGTWRRRSFVITGRRPLAKDLLQLDYDVDSDDEWEEEEPGESITQSEGEEDEDLADDDDDEDVKFLVPHGYLSDDEGVDAEDGERGEEGENESLEMKKLRQRLSLAEYETAHRRGLQKLKPLLLGPVWLQDPLRGVLPTLTTEEGTEGLNNEGPEDDKENIEFTLPTTASSSSTKEATSTVLSHGEHELMRSALNAYRIFLWGTHVPVVPQFSLEPPTPTSRTLGRPNRKSFPDEALPYFVHLVHKNTLGKLKLQFEFRVFWQHQVTGKMPDCTRFSEYKSQGHADLDKSSNSPAVSDHDLRHTSNRITLESLSLSKSCVYAKLKEVAAFAEGHWAVKQETLEKYKGMILAGLEKGVKTAAAFLPLSDPGFNFPAWNYVTDVNTPRGRPAQPEKLVAVSPVLPKTPPTKTSKSGSKPRKLVALTTLTLEVNSPNQPQLPATKAVVQSPSAHLSLADTTVSPLRRAKLAKPSPKSSVVTDASSPKTPATAKRRITLETFFSPPSAKRKKATEENAIGANEVNNSDEDCIMID